MKLIVLSSLFVIIASWNVTLHYNSIVIIMTLFLAVMYIKTPFTLDTETLFITLSFLLVFTIMHLANTTLHIDVNYESISKFIKKISFQYIFFVLMLFIFLKRRDTLIKSINIALTIFVSLWFLQLTTYYITGEYIDLLKPINGVEQRYQAYFMGSGGGPNIIRPTSVFNEPGTYAMTTLPLLILSYIDKRKITKLHIFTLVSYFASFSLFAMISATLFSLIIMMEQFEFKMNKKNIWIFTIFIFISTIVGIGLKTYFEVRFVTEGNTGALDLRGNIINYWFSLNSLSIIFGQGFAQTIFPLSVVDDTSLGFKLLYEYGVFSFPLFILMFYLSWGLPVFMLFLILLTKMSYMYYIFWFYFAALYIIHKKGSQL